MKKTSANRLPPIERVQALLDYDRETGVFVWKPRGSRFFDPIYAGKPAGSNVNGYWIIMLDGVNCRAHRIAWLLAHGEDPPNDIDHIDNNPLNNRIANLRIATRAENLANSRQSIPNPLGRGVRKHGNRFAAYMRVNGIQTCIAVCDTPEEAAAAYAAAKIEAFGDFVHGDIRQAASATSGAI